MVARRCSPTVPRGTWLETHLLQSMLLLVGVRAQQYQEKLTFLRGPSAVVDGGGCRWLVESLLLPLSLLLTVLLSPAVVSVCAARRGKTYLLVFRIVIFYARGRACQVLARGARLESVLSVAFLRNLKMVTSRNFGPLLKLITCGRLFLVFLCFSPASCTHGILFSGKVPTLEFFLYELGATKAQVRLLLFLVFRRYPSRLERGIISRLCCTPTHL